jgi:hypothetical protein
MDVFEWVNQMADDLRRRGREDRERINVHELSELRWSHKFGVSHEELKAAVEVAGPMADDVARQLGKELV